jgi:hypothetical protein
MATGNIAVGLDLNDEDKTDSLYHGGVTGFNPDIENTSGAYYWEPAAEIKWLRNRNNVTMQENKELRLEIKVYKKMIKKLLKKQ